jgi:hypothetical protein
MLMQRRQFEETGAIIVQRPFQHRDEGLRSGMQFLSRTASAAPAFCKNLAAGRAGPIHALMTAAYHCHYKQ